MNKFDVLFILAIITTVLLNIAIISRIIRNALKKYALPVLDRNNVIYKAHEWTGLIDQGDFGRAKMTLGPFLRSNITLSIFVYVYYIENDQTKRTTIKIDTLMMFIKRVTFSDARFNNNMV